MQTKSSPFDREGIGHILFGSSWVGPTFGSLFIALGIAILFMYPRAKRKSEEYRKRQLEEYNKKNKKSEKNYSATGMFLPAIEKAKLFAPAFFGSLFIIIGIAWITGTTLSSL